jgi:hypothetical protein
MPDFVRGGAAKTPFGANEYLRSTVGCKFESYTVAASTVSQQTIDGVVGQRVLQPGTLMAKITSGPDAGKVGPWMPAGTSEIQTVTPTTVTAGTFKLTITNPGTGVVRTTAPIAWNATMATITAALVALDNVDPGDVVAAGAATANAGAWTVTFTGAYAGNPAQMTVDNTGLTGTFAVTTTTAGVAGSGDGRSTLANIVGLNDTFLPWQLMEGDREIAVMYIGTAVQAWCLEYDSAGLPVALADTRADACRSVKGLDITFK